MRYSLICEDVAHKTFIEVVLPLILEKESTDVQIDFNEKFYFRFKSRNSKDVLKKYPEASIIAFRDYSINLLLIGVDYDDRNRNAFSQEIDRLYEQIDSELRNKCVIFFPVQAIEHWLMFIEYKNENPKSTKRISSDIEKITRTEAKKKVYGNSYRSREIQVTKIEQLSQNIDLKWLISSSESFKRFNYDLLKSLGIN